MYDFSDVLKKGGKDKRVSFSNLKRLQIKNDAAIMIFIRSYSYA